MADIGSDAGLTREEGALHGASKLFSFLWSEAWEQVTATQAGDADALHDMRVAFRRLRTALENFEGQKREATLSKPLRRELKEWRTTIGKLGDHLGAVRDFDVLTDYVRKFDTNHTQGLEEFAQILSRERDKQFGAMLGKLARANENDGLRDQFARWSLGLPAARLETSLLLGKVAHQILSAHIEEATTLGPALTDNDEEAHHEVRKSLRRLRYTLEMFSPCFDKPVKKPIKRLVEMQDLLGEMQDHAVLADWVKHSFKHPPADVEAFAKHGTQRHKELLHEVRDLWKKRETEDLWGSLKKLVPSTSE